MTHPTLQAESPFGFLTEREKESFCLNRVKPLKSPQHELLD